MVEEGCEDDGSLWDPRPHLVGRLVVGLIEARDLSVAEVCQKPTSQIVTQSEAVDHLDKETVRDCVELFRDVHRYGYCSAKGVTLVEARNHPSRNTEQGRGGGVPLFDAVLGLACIQYLHDRRE